MTRFYDKSISFFPVIMKCMNKGDRQPRFAAPLFCLLFLLIVPQAFPEGAALVLSPREWQFGTMDAGSRAFLTLHVTNTTTRDVTISVLPTCDCLSTGPSRLLIRPGSQGDFRFSFLAEVGEAGPVSESYIIQTDVKGREFFSYRVSGVVKAPPPKP
jgi:hypothetical protein